MKSLKSVIRNVFLFLFIILLTYYYVLRKANIFSIIKIIKNANVIFVLFAVISMSFYFVWEAFNLKCLLKSLNQKISLIRGIKYVLICFFFSGITPGATGGQPVEVYYMTKDNIDGSKATLSVLIQLFSYKIACLSLAFFAFFVHFNSLIFTNKIIFILGFIIYLIPLFLLFMCIFKPAFINTITNVIIAFLYKTGIKGPKNNQKAINEKISNYNEYASFLKTNKSIFIKSLCISFLGILSSYFVSYYIYLALGFNEFSFFTIVTTQALLYAMASWVPLPGAIGASELVYLNIFSRFYPEDSLISALCLSRGITFYLFIIIGLLIFIYSKLKTN